MSETPPPALASGEEPNVPASNRKMIRTVVFGANAQMMLNTTNGTNVHSITNRCEKVQTTALVRSATT